MKKELWLRLKHYHFDDLVPSHLKDHVLAMFGGADASTQAFASKLARKLGWSRPFALEAINEYRKFVFLGVVGDFPVTPPKVIDQVWHEHLLFSRGYRDFCRNVLQCDFDHHPELVATDDQTETFQSQYVATLDFYQQEFHVAPPTLIWGTPKFAGSERTGKTAQPKRKSVDRRSSTASSRDDSPLYLCFDSSSSDGGGSYHSMAEFGGGGGFSGAGGESSWGDSHGSSHGSSHGGDSSSSDSSSGSDSGGGGGDGGGSGCSSGCGGGGCGGGD